MKYKVTMRRVTLSGTQLEEKIVEADKYTRDKRTYTFFRGNEPIATYEGVVEVESEDVSDS